MHQLMRETARHLQAQAIPRIIQNRVDLQGPLQQERLFTNVRTHPLASLELYPHSAHACSLAPQSGHWF